MLSATSSIYQQLKERAKHYDLNTGVATANTTIVSEIIGDILNQIPEFLT